ncbi:co-chaperone YbbN [Angustibacter sp. Root456]|jgi:thioredoxin 1|uniref:thioredoxin family protein n=1 Tax=Angustibacter sp. Root456 TaxID=1736539 RepID=UPI0006FD1C6D|nr:thioredoxin domain-containing protein [Angustibacter sp. Root456]KQX65709.1 thioredoxin [Angustibacter sp. Root456]
MATTALTPETHDETVQDGIVLIDFWAEWCGPCRQFGPVFERVSEENPDARFVKVDTEAEPELAARYGVTSIPMLVIYRDGIPVFGQPGALPQPALEDLLRQVRELDMDQVKVAYEQQLASAQAGGSDRKASTDPTSF